MKEEILKEIIPITLNDCYTILSRVKTDFDFPLHYHDAFELNYLRNTKGAKRIIGSHMEDIEDEELVMVGPNLEHAWFRNNCITKDGQEITLQFHKDLIDDKLLNRTQLYFIKNLFELSYRGILFSKETTIQIRPRIINLSEKKGFDGVLELLSILHDLSISRNMRILSAKTIHLESHSYTSRRIEKALDYMNKNFDKHITLTAVSKIANMTEAPFSRFFKSKTGSNFVDSLNEIRISHATKMLIETSQMISEIAYQSGFNSMANFNKLFKRKKGLTPKEYRDSYHQSAEQRVFI